MMIPRKMSQIDDDEIIVDKFHDKASESLSASFTSNKGNLTSNDIHVALYNSQQSIIVHQNIVPNSSFVVPTENDVLCGRGKAFFNHPGNKKFREIVGNTIGTYLMARRKSEKSKIVITIADEVMRTGARFLKRKGKGKDWYEGGLNLARQKIGHAIRDATANKSQAIFHIYSRQRYQDDSEINSTDFISHCNSDDFAKFEIQYNEFENLPIFGCNSIQQGIIDERRRSDHAFMNYFHFRSPEQIMTDNRESTSGTMPEKHSRNSSTSSFDSTYIDIFNDLNCEELNFFLGLYAPL